GIYKELGLKQLKLVINSLGDSGSRNAHREALINHFKPRIGEFCGDCQNRLEKNPLRILDCKKDRDHELMSSAPSILEYLNDESREYFEKVQRYLRDMDVEFEVDPTLVRGLDYYNHTAFEIMSNAEGFGAITTLCGGGRYNGLVEEIGGPETPGIGFAFSIERLLSALEAEGVNLPINEGIDLFIVSLGDEAKDYAVKLLHLVRREGIVSEKDYLDRKLKAQFKAADRCKAKYVAVIGENELKENKINLKDMATGEQEEVNLDQFVDRMRGKLTK
ncbi:histidine--tRNA ligase, partial [Bacillus haikouensis]|uniref:histidine--tRNA ligase n=1 Tax=Bacillus haikouensis TaxID=1510468 RepID=UPI0015577167